jgi:hypothetical protein
VSYIASVVKILNATGSLVRFDKKFTLKNALDYYYNASVVKIYSETNSLARFVMKIIFFGVKML